MKVLVATKDEQGNARGDFSWTKEGELVTLGSECDGEPWDGPCGCRRSLAGLESLKATTTFKVVERPGMTPEIIRRALEDYLRRGRWIGTGGSGDAEMIEVHVKETLALYKDFAAWPEGTVIRRQGDRFVAARKAAGRRA